eukprot:scaffold20353_cov72-Phaeocystis_antarctica.AAC.1
MFGLRGRGRSDYTIPGTVDRNVAQRRARGVTESVGVEGAAGTAGAADAASAAKAGTKCGTRAVAVGAAGGSEPDIAD